MFRIAAPPKPAAAPSPSSIPAPLAELIPPQLRPIVMGNFTDLTRVYPRHAEPVWSLALEDLFELACRGGRMARMAREQAQDYAVFQRAQAEVHEGNDRERKAMAETVARRLVRRCDTEGLGLQYARNAYFKFEKACNPNLTDDDVLRRLAYFGRSDLSTIAERDREDIRAGYLDSPSVGAPPPAYEPYDPTPLRF